MGNDYFNTAEVAAACQQLAADHAPHVELLSLREPTHEGRAVTALRLCEDVKSTVRKPRFMVVGGLHGCEWGSSEILINLAADLLQGRASGLDYGGGVVYTDKQVQSVLQGLDLLLLPLANPDSRFFGQTSGEVWRKNRSLEQSSSGPGIGVDLNRNFDYKFSESTQAPSSPFYAGPSALSEPETQNVAALVQERDPDWFVDLHSGARCVVYPWSVEQPLAPMPQADQDAHLKLGGDYAAAAQKVSGTPVQVMPGFQFISASGTSHDWVYSRQRSASPRGGGSGARSGQTLAFCIEWSSDPVPLWWDMRALMRETGAGLIAMCLSVLT